MNSAKPPSIQLDKGTWFVENFDNSEVTLDKAEIKHNIHIYKCHKTVVYIPETVKSVSIVACDRTKLVIKNIISVVDIINSTSCNIHLDIKSPSVYVDKCTGTRVILSETSATQPPEIYTSQSSETILVVPDNNPKNVVEHAIGHQLITTYANGEITTVLVKHQG